MKKSKKIYTVFHKGSAIFMILTLLWLTISTPLVFASQQELAGKHQMEKTNSPLTNSDEESSNPLGNNTDEKAPNPNNFAEEYLHEHPVTEHHFISETRQYYKCEDDGIYIAYHGELLVPPPNAV